MESLRTTIREPWSVKKTYKREVKYAYLNEKYTASFDVFVRNFIKNIDISKKINQLKLDIFIERNFDYKEIWSDFLTGGIYQQGNIYYEIDTFCRDNNINESVPANRNTLSNILETIYHELMLEEKFNNKLVKILERNPLAFKDFWNVYEDELNTNVKLRCQWMLVPFEFNLI